MCSLNSQISPVSKNCAPIQHESVKSLRTNQSLISSACHGYCNVFFVGKLMVVGSGTSMTKCCVVIIIIMIMITLFL